MGISDGIRQAMGNQWSQLGGDFLRMPMAPGAEAVVKIEAFSAPVGNKGVRIQVECTKLADLRAPTPREAVLEDAEGKPLPKEDRDYGVPNFIDAWPMGAKADYVIMMNSNKPQQRAARQAQFKKLLGGAVKAFCAATGRTYTEGMVNNERAVELWLDETAQPLAGTYALLKLSKEDFVKPSFVPLSPEMLAKAKQADEALKAAAAERAAESGADADGDGGELDFLKAAVSAAHEEAGVTADKDAKPF